MKSKRTCEEGHVYYKSSDCPVCPVCAAEQMPVEGFYSFFSAPAFRALVANDVKSVKDAAGFSKSEIASWHGIGPSALRTLEKLMKQEYLNFKISK